MEYKTDWANLPLELLGKIFSYLSFYDRSLTLPLVCRNWAKVCYDPLLNRSYTINGDYLCYEEILQKLRAAPFLKCLRIVNRNDLNTFLKDVGKYNRKLKVLKIKKCLGSTKNQKNISSLVLMSLLTKCKLIEDLTIKYTPVRSKKLFIRLGNMVPNLKRICLADMDSNDLSMVIKGCRNLQSIKLPSPCSNLMKDDIIKEIGHEIGKRLKTLKLNAASLTDASIDCLLRNCPHLKGIHLLQPIKLSNSAITRISEFSELKALSLTHIHVRWTDLQFFTEWSTKLIMLNLSGCSNVTDSVLNDIAIYCCHLEKLDISMCRNFTHIGLSNIFKNCKQLMYLNLYLTPYSLMRELHTTLSHHKALRLKRLIYQPCDSDFWEIVYDSMLNSIQVTYPHLQILSSVQDIT